MKNQISTNVTKTRTARRSRSKDDYGQFVTQEENVQFLCFWLSVVLIENHPMRPLVKGLIEHNEEIDLRTAALLFQLYQANKD